MTISRQDFPADDDGEVLFRLVSKGIDLGVKRKIEFTCYASSRKSAQKIAEELKSYGYESTIFVDEGEGGTGDVLVYAGLLMLPDYELLLAEQRRLNAILRFHEASCDGWITQS